MDAKTGNNLLVLSQREDTFLHIKSVTQEREVPFERSVVCQVFVHVDHLSWLRERNEGLRSHSPASSHMCHVGHFLLHAVTAKEWHFSTGSRMQQVCSLHHVVGDDREPPRSTAYFTHRQARR